MGKGAVLEERLQYVRALGGSLDYRLRVVRIERTTRPVHPTAATEAIPGVFGCLVCLCRLQSNTHG